MKYITLIIGLLVAAGCSKSLTEEEKKVVGSYETKKDGNTFRKVYLGNGVVESYENGKKYEEDKWSISKEGEIHIKYVDGTPYTGIIRINTDKSITDFAFIIGGKRTDFPKKGQKTYKKIK